MATGGPRVPFQFSSVRDPAMARTFTPLGRPLKKPRKVVRSLSSIDSNRDLDEYYFLEKPQTAHSRQHIGLRQCCESRPPLPLGLGGPTPCTYSLPQPTYRTVGGKINPRAKYSRDALPSKNSEVWTLNVSTLEKSPAPCAYTAPNAIGSKCPTKRAVPSYSMRGRTDNRNKGRNSAKHGPSSYNTAKAADYVMRRFTTFTIHPCRSRSHTVSTPGPAHYSPSHTLCQHQSPSYTIRTRTATT